MGWMLGFRKRERFPGSCFQKFWFRNFNIMQFKQGDVFLRRNTIHSFKNALLGGCHFSRVPQIGLMSVARFSWVPNLYNIHFLVENHRPQPDPVNSYRDVHQLQTNPFQSSPIYQTYSIRRQSPHFRRLSSQATSPIGSPPRRRLLWKTHHPRNWARPRISRFHAWNPTFGTHLHRPNQHFPSPVTILSSITTESSSERF